MIDRQGLTDAVRAFVAASTGRPVGVKRAPLGEDRMPRPRPVAVLHPIEGGGYDGSYADPAEDVVVVYQVDSIGERTDSAEWLADRVRRGFLERNGSGGFARPIMAAGLVCWHREPLGGPGGVDQEEGPVFVVRERFALHVSAVASLRLSASGVSGAGGSAAAAVA